MKISHQPGSAAVLVAGLFLTACSPAPAPLQPARRDETREPWYGRTVASLAAENLKATSLLKRGKADDAAAIIQSAEPLATRLLSVTKPTLAAVEGASDLDALYGGMLLTNRNYGWARLFFQKNLVRWRNWTPPTADTARRLRDAQSAIAECDRRLSEP